MLNNNAKDITENRESAMEKIDEDKIVYFIDDKTSIMNLLMSLQSTLRCQ